MSFCDSFVQGFGFTCGSLVAIALLVLICYGAYCIMEKIVTSRRKDDGEN
jgi:hypothetical protein